MLDPDACGDVRQERHQGRTHTAEEMALRSRRVRQGSEDVEYGAHAELPTRPYRVLHCGMELRGEHEAETVRVKNPLDLRRLEVHPGSEGLEQVRTPAGACDRPVSGRRDPHAGRRDDEHG